jgi:hypothetical protein
VQSSHNLSPFSKSGFCNLHFLTERIRILKLTDQSSDMLHPDTTARRQILFNCQRANVLNYREAV